MANVGPPQEERERTIHDSLNVVNRGREKDIRELGGKRNTSVKVSHKSKASDFVAHDKGSIF